MLIIGEVYERKESHIVFSRTQNEFICCNMSYRHVGRAFLCLGTVDTLG